MSIQASILNFFLKKYVKNVQPPVEERSYIEARRMMNQQGYEEASPSFFSKFLQQIIFNKKKSNLDISEIYLDKIRTLHINHESFAKEKCILYFHGGGYIAGSH